jgi:hypothetical protein
MGKRYLRILGVGAVISASIVCFQNCSGFNADAIVDGTSSASSLTDEPALTKPAVDCSLIRVSDNTILRRINSLTPAESFSASVTEGEQLRLDCSQSRVTSGGAIPEKFQLITDTSQLGAPSVSNSGVFSLSFPAASRVPMQLDLFDASGKKTSKVFDIVIRCATTQAPPSIDDSKVSVQPGSQPGFFNISASGAVSGGRAPYQYAWDFQGDGGMDMQSQSGVWTSWGSSASVQNIYSLFANTRKLRLQVRDACNLITMHEMDRTFALERLPASSPAMPKSFYYLQGDIRPEGSVAAPNPRVATVDFMAEQPANPPDGRKHMQCFYKRDASTGIGGLRIVSKNIYGSESEVQFDHSASLTIKSISDNGAMGSVAVGSPQIDTAVYNVAGIADFSDYAVYNKAAACTLNLRMTRSTAVVPCASDSTKFANTVTFLGEYDCPSLRSTAGAGVSIDNGKFFCEQGEIDMCPGGGGGGGGGNPPPAQ